MLALKLYKDSLCPGCGGDFEVTGAPENEDRFHHLPPLQCFRCVAFGIAHEAYKDDPHPQSLIHLVPPKPRR
jgi:hypothetical protein